jgi:hypothetical protein
MGRTYRRWRSTIVAADPNASEIVRRAMSERIAAAELVDWNQARSSIHAGHDQPTRQASHMIDAARFSGLIHTLMEHEAREALTGGQQLCNA